MRILKYDLLLHFTPSKLNVKDNLLHTMLLPNHVIYRI